MDKLDALEVKKNCPASWSRMEGSDTVRHCTHCKHNVYNLTNMTRVEAMELIETTEGRLCTRFYRRKDGTIITKDCGFKASPWVYTLRAVTGAVGLAVILALFTPVHAGAGSFSPKFEKKQLQSKIKLYNDLLKEEKDPEARREYLELRRKVYGEIAALYERYADDPSQLEDRS